jgi:hypothetical protein
LWPVRILDLRPDELFSLWKIVDRQPFFLDDSTHDPYTLGAILTSENARVFFLGPEIRKPDGLIYAHGITRGVSAGVAALIWGRSAVGRDDLHRLAMLAVARESNLHRFYAHIAEPNISGQRIAARLAFRREGSIRSSLCYNGVWTDIALYGLLCEEIC